MFRIRIQLNPDPAKSLNPDPDTIPSYFLTLSENNTKLFHNYTIFSSKEVNWKIYWCKKWYYNILDLFLSPWIRIRIQKTPECGSETRLTMVYPVPTFVDSPDVWVAWANNGVPCSYLCRLSGCRSGWGWWFSLNLHHNHNTSVSNATKITYATKIQA